MSSVRKEWISKKNGFFLFQIPSLKHDNGIVLILFFFFIRVKTMDCSMGHIIRLLTLSELMNWSISMLLN